MDLIHVFAEKVKFVVVDYVLAYEFRVVGIVKIVVLVI
jgi:hypothetical protein